MVEGAGLGASARAALMTRGFAEMTRLAVAMGARPETLAGLSGLGDLSLTCNSAQSRNFALGRALGAGEGRPGGTVEGVATARAACQLAARARRRAADRRGGRRRARGRRRSPARWRRCSPGRCARNDGERRRTMTLLALQVGSRDLELGRPGGARAPPGQEWDGVRNFQARNHMKAMRRGRPRLLLSLGRHQGGGRRRRGDRRGAPRFDRRRPALGVRRHPRRGALPAPGDARGDQGRPAADGDGAGEELPPLGAAGQRRANGGWSARWAATTG